MSKIWNKYALRYGGSIFRADQRPAGEEENKLVRGLERGLREGFRSLGRKCWKCGGKGVKTRLITKGKHSCGELPKSGVTRRNIV